MNATTHRDTIRERLMQILRDRPELIAFALLLVVFNAPLPGGTCWTSMVFQPGAVVAGEWWRVVTHPWVHVTWYHLLLDGVAFLTLDYSLATPRLERRLGYVIGGGLGSLLASWWAAPGVAAIGLCGLSGVAHGLMAVSGAEMIDQRRPRSSQSLLGWAVLAAVVGKVLFEAISGRAFWAFLHFGLMGEPIAVSHAGGVIGGLAAMLFCASCQRTDERSSPQGLCST